jgi:hypothetical protein
VSSGVRILPTDVETEGPDDYDPSPRNVCREKVLGSVDSDPISAFVPPTLITWSPSGGMKMDDGDPSTGWPTSGSSLKRR